VSLANRPAISFSVAIFYNDVVRHYLLDQPLTRVGREPSSDIMIADPTISRHQLALELRAESVWVQMNPDSPNVMVCNGRAETAQELYPGQVFYVGPYRFEIHAAAELPEARRQALNEDRRARLMSRRRPGWSGSRRAGARSLSRPRTAPTMSRSSPMR